MSIVKYDGRNIPEKMTYINDAAKDVRFQRDIKKRIEQNPKKRSREKINDFKEKLIDDSAADIYEQFLEGNDEEKEKIINLCKQKIVTSIKQEMFEDFERALEGEEKRFNNIVYTELKHRVMTNINAKYANQYLGKINDEIEKVIERNYEVIINKYDMVTTKKQKENLLKEFSNEMEPLIRKKIPEIEIEYVFYGQQGNKLVKTIYEALERHAKYKGKMLQKNEPDEVGDGR